MASLNPMKTPPTEAEVVAVRSITGSQAWGSENGHSAYLRLDEAVRETQTVVIALDFSGVNRADVSWSREAIGGILMRHRLQRWFYLTNVDTGIEENIDAALKRLELTIISRQGSDRFVLIGKPLNSHLIAVLNIVESEGEVTSGDIVSRLRGLTLTNCNNRLKQLVNAGLVIRQDPNPGSGREFLYQSLR